MTATKQNLSITRDMKISKIFSNFPAQSQRLSQEITNAGLHCVGCSASTRESIEEGMRGHGMGEDLIDGLIGRLNEIIDEEVDLTTVTLTQRAANKFVDICRTEGKEGWGLRLVDKKSGCKGYQHVLDFAKEPQADDVIFEAHGVSVFLAKESEERLLGSQIDYVDGLQGAGFKVTNPNAKKSCGCGNSHGY
jgi:iron-sulfur cluster assembly protein